MGEKLDRWGKAKREAIKDYDRASLEYLQRKSFLEKYLDELKRAKIMSKLPWYKRWGINGIALQSTIKRHVMAILSEMGGSAAQLAPDSWKGVAFDLCTLGVGAAAGTVGKIAKLGKLNKFGRFGAKMPVGADVFKALKDIHIAGGFPEIALRTAQLQNAQIATQKIIRSAKAVHKATDVVHAVHMGEKSGKTLVKTLTEHRTSIAPTKTTLIPRIPLPNIDSQIRVNLPQPRKSTKREKTRQSKSLPPLNRIEGLPKLEGGSIPGPDIGDILESTEMDRMRKYLPPLPPHKPSVPSPYKHVPSESTSDIWAGSRPFDWKSNAIPPEHLQSTIRPHRPGQPGWGEEVSRSRPAAPIRMQNSGPPMNSFQSSSLGHMGQGLINQDKARPMMNSFQSMPLGQMSEGLINHDRARPPMNSFQSMPLGQMSEGLINHDRARPPMNSFKSSSLRHMGQGLINRDRARPMMRAPMFR